MTRRTGSSSGPPTHRSGPIMLLLSDQQRARRAMFLKLEILIWFGRFIGAASGLQLSASI